MRVQDYHRCKYRIEQFFTLQNYNSVELCNENRCVQTNVYPHSYFSGNAIEIMIIYWTVIKTDAEKKSKQQQTIYLNHANRIHTFIMTRRTHEWKLARIKGNVLTYSYLKMFLMWFTWSNETCLHRYIHLLYIYVLIWNFQLK